MSSHISPRPDFATTRWSVVLAARDREDSGAREALELLCGNYWYPLYAYARRRGFDADDAAELTQGFFARFLEKDFLRGVKRERGRFRAFLLAALKHFLSNERDRAGARKRGGGRTIVSIDAAHAEGRYSLEPVDQALSPEKLYERRWALLLVERVLGQLRAEHERNSRLDVFECLKERLSGKGEYKEAAEKLGLTESGVKAAVHRMRKRYRELLREEIAQTVAKEGDVEDEIRYLFQVLAG